MVKSKFVHTNQIFAWTYAAESVGESLGTLSVLEFGQGLRKKHGASSRHLAVFRVLAGTYLCPAFKASLVGNQKQVYQDSVCFHDKFRTLAPHWHPKLIVLIGFSLGNFILNNSCKEQKIIVINSVLKLYLLYSAYYLSTVSILL